MIYSSRLKKILHHCLTHREEYVPLEDMAQLMKISKRTIFRELKDIDQDLKSYHLRLENVSGKGLHVEGSEEMKDALLLELQIQGIEYINKEERQHLLIFELLRSDTLTKLLHYANLFQVSEATISNDLDNVEKWFDEHQLVLSRKPGLGVEVVGKESDVRKAMTSLLHETLQKSKVYDEVNYLDSKDLLQIFMKDDQQSIMRLLNQEILERILQVFQTYRHELALDRYAQASYIGLIIHLVIAIDRIIKKEEIMDNEAVLAMVQEDASFLQAQKMAQYLELEFDIDIPKTEIAFIALHIKGSKISSVEYSDVQQEEVEKIHQLILNMLKSYDEEIRIQLLQDEEFYRGLLTHLEPTIIRLKNHLPIYNPLLDQIKEMYSALYEQTRNACEHITTQYQCEVSEDEVAFITMHVGASLERTRQSVQHTRDITIGVVCASGIGVSAMLSARIQKAFPKGVHMHVLSMDEVVKNQYQDCELLVSTFPLTNTSVDVYCVSPLLNGEDVQRLKKAFEQLQSEIQPILEGSDTSFIEQVTYIKNLSEGILQLMKHTQCSSIDETISYEEMILRIAKDHGEQTQQIQQIQTDILEREKLGKVVMEDFGFTLFHTLSDGVEKSALHFYYPNKEVFTSDDFSKMKFIMVLLANKKKDIQQQKILSVISRGLIDHDSFYEAVLGRKQEEILMEISSILKEYLMECLEDTL
ncbi:BglG family transcription antiterminator [Amedibacillus sp. YH-ame6]